MTQTKRPRTDILSRRLAGVALTAVLIFGCGGPDVPMQKTVKVTGKVLLDGQPAAGVDVRLIPLDPTHFKLNETPIGRSDEAGKVTFTTYYSDDGVPKGKYKVVVAYPDQPPVAAEDDETAAALAAGKQKKARAGKRLPAIYQNPDKSGLTVTVDQPGELPPFELSGKAK